MIIKAKYPKIGHRGYSMGVQGYGSLYASNNISNIIKANEGSFSNAFSSSYKVDISPRKLIVTNESIFPKDTIKEITRSLKNRSTYYENELNTIKILNEGNPIGGSPISEIISIERTDTLVAVHESVFPLNPAEVISMRLKDRSTYYENEVATLKILNDLVDL